MSVLVVHVLVQREHGVDHGLLPGVRGHASRLGHATDALQVRVHVHLHQQDADRDVVAPREQRLDRVGVLLVVAEHRGLRILLLAREERFDAHDPRVDRPLPRPSGVLVEHGGDGVVGDDLADDPVRIRVQARRLVAEEELLRVRELVGEHDAHAEQRHADVTQFHDRRGEALVVAEVRGDEGPRPHADVRARIADDEQRVRHVRRGEDLDVLVSNEHRLHAVVHVELTQLAGARALGAERVESVRGVGDHGRLVHRQEGERRRVRVHLGRDHHGLGLRRRRVRRGGGRGRAGEESEKEQGHEGDSGR